jgi:hypothetical protein
MIGAYEVIVKSRRLQYKFTISRNITILRGDSATGKTTLIDMISSHQQNGISSGITINCQKPCTVLTGIRWLENLKTIHDSIVFIDEGDQFALSEEFAKAAQESDNYYVIATRASLFNLPYSIKEIYGIKNVSGNRYQGTKRLFSEFYPLCNVDIDLIQKPDLVILEDSNSGYQFFNDFFSKREIDCISANGKSNIYKELIEREYATALVIADGAEFGPEIERVLAVKKARNVIVYLPESFEWIVLNSGLVKGQGISDILQEPSSHIESSQYFSWERFFTALLIQKTNKNYLQYNKTELNPAYLQDHEQMAIIDVLPEIQL